MSIFVTKPFLPPLEEVTELLKTSWKSRIVSNRGPLHQQLEIELQKRIGSGYVSLVSNATLGLYAALMCSDLKGEVITTSYTFPATASVIRLANLTPVIVDIADNNVNICADLVERAITGQTSAILGVHVYGEVCDHFRLSALAQQNDLRLIYDAAHAFDVKSENGSILNLGDFSVVSFHATKTFNTFEGGMVVSKTFDQKAKVDEFINFGIKDAETISSIGLNAKMSEFNAALGLVQLRYIDEVIARRKHINDLYVGNLNENSHISIWQSKMVYPNYSYFPIFVKNGEKERNELFKFLQKSNIYTRKYFYPSLGEVDTYKKFKYSDCTNSRQISGKVICLPIYPDLQNHEILQICQKIYDFYS